MQNDDDATTYDADGSAAYNQRQLHLYRPEHSETT